MQYRPAPATDISPADVLDIIRRRRGIIIGSFLACLLTGAVVTIRSPRIYSATSQIAFYRPAYAVVLTSPNIAPPPVEDKGTQVYLLQGKAVADEISRYLGERGINASAKDIRESLRIKDIENTDLIGITSETQDARMSMLIANAAADAFIIYKRRTNQSSQLAALETLQKQLSSARRELAVRERAVAAYAEKHGITDVKKESDARFQQIVAYEGRLLESTMARAEARGRADALARQLRIQDYAIKVTGVIRDNTRVNQLRDKLVDLELQLAEAERKYTEKYPGKLSELRNAAANIRGVLAKEIDNIVNYKAGSLDFQAELRQKLAAQETDYVALSARCDAIRSILAEVRREIVAQPMKEVQMTNLQRAAGAATQVYTTLLNSFEAIKADTARQTSAVQVTERAALPERPIRPNPARNMAFALLVGTVMALFGALVMERLDNTLRTPEEAKRYLELPVLGQIPRADGPETLITNCHPRSYFCESYRKLRSNISFVGVDIPIHTMVVTSATDSEGKSLTCVNLAITAAQEGRRVVLVDADLRKPSIERILGLLPGTGLTDVLRGEVGLGDAIRSFGIPGMQVLTAGTPPPNPAELIGSERMRTLVQELSSAADLVIFDSSPCNLVADPVILSSRVDAVVQVIDAERVSRDAALQAKEALTTARARIAGLVLNKVPGTSGSYYYHHSSESQGAAYPKRSRRRR